MPEYFLLMGIYRIEAPRKHCTGEIGNSHSRSFRFSKPIDLGK